MDAGEEGCKAGATRRELEDRNRVKKVARLETHEDSRRPGTSEDGRKTRNTRRKSADLKRMKMVARPETIEVRIC